MAPDDARTAAQRAAAAEPKVPKMTPQEAREEAARKAAGAPKGKVLDPFFSPERHSL